jgi:hypothetical protein
LTHKISEPLPEYGDWRYDGIENPNFTMYPNDLLDNVKPRLTRAEGLVLDRIVRNTFGWQRPEGTQISQSLLIRETGLKARSSVQAALDKLVAANVVQREHRTNPETGDEANYYSLVVKSITPDSSTSHPPLTGVQVTLKERATERKVSGPTSSSPDVEEDSGTTHAPVPKKRRIDPLWDAVVAGLGIDTGSITSSARGAINLALKELRGVSNPVTPEEIPKLVAAYQTGGYIWALTPSTLTKYLHELRVPAKRSSGRGRKDGRAVGQLTSDVSVYVEAGRRNREARDAERRHAREEGV